MDERKIKSGGAFFIGDSLVAWLSKKQGSISLSTIEVEYIARFHFSQMNTWITRQARKKSQTLLKHRLAPVTIIGELY